MPQLSKKIMVQYKLLQPAILRRLKDFAKVPESDYFYELCFCLCTPQSKAANALIVQQELMKHQFYRKPFDVSGILRKPENYIRFHNTKAKRLLEAIQVFPGVESILNSELTTIEKRNVIAKTVTGLGMKEASHFMRNIGYRNLAILDRHILKHLVACGLYDSVPKISTFAAYLSVEQSFLDFSRKLKIPIDELDLLFWSYETGEILK